MTRYLSTKRYGHERGLSCAFRQWRATSHCNKLHGYSLSFEFVFGAEELDEKNWVVDFGNLKELENWLRAHFDHKTAVAFDDPLMDWFWDLQNEGIIDLVGVEGTGCEMFAKMAHDFASNLMFEKYKERCWVESVEVREHGANSAIYRRNNNAHRN